jgi:hypothetical protein
MTNSLKAHFLVKKKKYFISLNFHFSKCFDYIYIMFLVTGKDVVDKNANLFNPFPCGFLQIFEPDENLSCGFFDDLPDEEESEAEDEFNSSKERAEFITRAVTRNY